MSTLLAFENIFEFILRYTVLTGMLVASVGVAICFMAKRITRAKRDTQVIDKRDGLYMGLLMIGLCLILVGMIIMVLPIEATLYAG